MTDITDLFTSNELATINVGEQPIANINVARSTYKLLGDSKIPVSKHTGGVWESRKKLAIHKYEDTFKSWQINYEMFRDTGSSHRAATGLGHSKRSETKQLDRVHKEQENIIYTNVMTMQSLLYSRNPTVELSSYDENKRDEIVLIERTMNAMLDNVRFSSTSIKPIAQRAICDALLSNSGWIEIGWTGRDQSTEQHIKELERISKEYAKATDEKTIYELEGQLMALERNTDLLLPEGCFVKRRSPFDILIDPNTQSTTLDDANWIMVRDFLPTDYILARFCKKDKDGNYHSIYQSDMMYAVNDLDRNKHTYDQLVGTNYEQLGYATEHEMRAAGLTTVWYVWDKVTRRVLLFRDSDWTWPIWVWDDPYKLDQFFPFYRLTLTPPVCDIYDEGEVSYYIDLQDGINDCNMHIAQARDWCRKNIVYNKSLLQDRTLIERILRGTEDAIGVEAPADADISKLFTSITPPAVDHQQLLDKSSLYRAIDRISSTNTIVSGGEFKTNTTNQAIATYQQASGIRIDDKQDAVEDWMSRTVWGLTQLMLMFASKDVVAQFVGVEAAQAWKTYSKDELSTTFAVKIQSGSTIKPTTMQKKQTALQLVQGLGQFANTSPIVVVKMLEILENAFDEVVMSTEEWQVIVQSIKQSLQQQQPQPQQQPNQAQQPVTQGATNV